MAHSSLPNMHSYTYALPPQVAALIMCVSQPGGRSVDHVWAQARVSSAPSAITSAHSILGATVLGPLNMLCPAGYATA